jgi:hypothetical protein
MNGFWKAQFREHVHGICAMLEAAAEAAKTKSLSMRIDYLQARIL